MRIVLSVISMEQSNPISRVLVSQKKLQTKIQKEVYMPSLALIIILAVIIKRQSNSIRKVFVSQRRLATKIQKKWPIGASELLVIASATSLELRSFLNRVLSCLRKYDSFSKIKMNGKSASEIDIKFIVFSGVIYYDKAGVSRRFLQQSRGEHRLSLISWNHSTA